MLQIWINTLSPPKPIQKPEIKVKRSKLEIFTTENIPLEKSKKTVINDKIFAFLTLNNLINRSNTIEKNTLKPQIVMIVSVEFFIDITVASIRFLSIKSQSKSSIFLVAL